MIEKSSRSVPRVIQPERRPRYEDPSYRLMKRTIDVLVSLFGLALLLPVFLLLGLLVYVGDPGPIFFRQKRLGRNGQEFWMFKFRSMRQDADQLLSELLSTNSSARAEFEATYKLKSDPRLIRFGSIIRRTSLDELPQLINVLKGDMSLVGPRPIVAPEAKKYGEAIEIYLRMKPGCAGLWQCSGRNDTTYEERVELDRQYYFEASVRRDFWVLWKTLVSMVRLKGAY